MFSWTALFAPLALMLPPAGTADDATNPAQLGPKKPIAEASASDQQWTAFEAWRPQGYPMQVRIERRVVIRVSPARPSNAAVLADLPRRFPDRFAERKMGKCFPMRSVAAVQTGGASRLILFLRDRRMISAQLEKACRARDFYSGFYVEPSDDGNLCINRDKLQSRTGAKCELSRIRQMVPVRN
ncbi:hypothetical protein [Parerythrobacter jejuensis]|uniref:Uncharacterized protein n=1 Tax=Parerythrobacter jejuensis TaxID=795812 RepID=A0A845AST6_9SPHN|nr:hypothetical protein [Parerythrobacter jejuensis]MXP32654.1 hypothetical protein [Parerythrobacter jejuensis]